MLSSTDKIILLSTTVEQFQLARQHGIETPTGAAILSRLRGIFKSYAHNLEGKNPLDDAIELYEPMREWQGEIIAIAITTPDTDNNEHANTDGIIHNYIPDATLETVLSETDHIKMITSIWSSPHI